jgi:uroporphyrinogen-III decarboxylase
MKPTITSDFIKKLTELFASHLISLIYTKVPHALYIDRPNFGSELIQESEYFQQMARELILDHLAEPGAHTVISISVKAQKLVFYTQDQWERHPFSNCFNITYSHYQFETHLVTLAIR